MLAFFLTKDGPIATLTFNRYKAVELQRMGMVHQVVPTAQLHDAVFSLAQSLTGRRQDAVEWSKATINALTRGQRVVRPDLLLGRE